MLLIDYFKTCWLLNILCIWWRHVDDQKDTACTQPLDTLSANTQLCLSQCWHRSSFHRCWCENAVSRYYREVLLMQKLLLIIRVHGLLQLYLPTRFHQHLYAHRTRRSISLIYSSASNQTSSRRCGPVQIVIPQPSRSQDMGRSSAAGELEWVSRFLTALQWVPFTSAHAEKYRSRDKVKTTR